MRFTTSYARILCIACVLSILGFSTQAAAAKWSEYYHEAQRASQVKDWEKAVEFFQKAIQEDSEPSSRKKYGMKSIKYFPYFELGIAYIGAGDIQAAHDACTQSLEKGAAPRTSVDQCLSVTSKYLSSLKGSQSHGAADSSPSVEITTEIPSRIREHTFDVKGVAKSGHGVQQIKISVTNLGITAVSTFGMRQGKQENFWITVPIDFGENDVLLEAIDTDGQIAKRQFTVFREWPEGTKQQTTAQNQPTPAPEPTPVTETPPAAIPTATPVPATPTPEPTQIVAENTPPEITVTSEIPVENDSRDLYAPGNRQRFRRRGRCVDQPQSGRQQRAAIHDPQKGRTFRRGAALRL